MVFLWSTLIEALEKKKMERSLENLFDFVTFRLHTVI